MIVRQPFLILQKRTAGREELSRLFKTTADRHQDQACETKFGQWVIRLRVSSSK